MTEPSHPEIDEIDDDDVDPATLPNVPDESEESPWLKIGRHSAKFVVAAIAIFLIIHFAFPALAGIGRSLEVVKDAEVGWIALAVLFSLLTQVSYIVVFKFSVGGTRGAAERRLGWSQSYEVTMASQAASKLVTAAGAGGIVLFLWVLARAGFTKTQAVARTIAFLAFYYVIYLGAIVVFGLALYLGIFPGAAPASLTLVPALVCIGLFVVLGVAAVSPVLLEDRMQRISEHEGREGRLARRLISVPNAVAAGAKHVGRLFRKGGQGPRVLLFAVLYWLFNIATLVACFEAFGGHVQWAGLVMAFFIGSTANLLPLLPGGVGSVEAGLIGAMLAFDQPGAQVVVAVLTYRLIGYWLPTIPQAIAYFQLNRTMGVWKEAAAKGAAASSAPADAPA